MHDLGAIIWLAIVLIGVISSIRRNIKRSRAQNAPQQPAMQQQPPMASPPPVPAPRSVLAGLAMPPVDAPPPPRPVSTPRPVSPPKPAAPQPVFPVIESRAPVGTSPIRGMFGGGATLVRAIVAAEVLGPPKAFQEQTIWSPRHSEPSI
jgi:hypothetical protein